MTPRRLLSPGEIMNGELRVGVDVTGAPVGSELLVALLQGGVETEVSSGENAGRTLSHENVVRARVHLAVDAGEAVLAVPSGVEGGPAGVVAIVQDRVSLHAHGATLAWLSQ